MPTKTRNYFNTQFLPVDTAPVQLVLAPNKITSTVLKIYLVNTDGAARTYTFWIVALGGDTPSGTSVTTFKNRVSIPANENDEVLGPIVLESGMTLWGGASVANTITVAGTGYDEAT